MLRSSEFLEYSQALAAAVDPGAAASVRPLGPGPAQHPRQCLAHQEVSLDTPGTHRSVEKAKNLNSLVWLFISIFSNDRRV